MNIYLIKPLKNLDKINQIFACMLHCTQEFDQSKAYILNSSANFERRKNILENKLYVHKSMLGYLDCDLFIVLDLIADL